MTTMSTRQIALLRALPARIAAPAAAHLERLEEARRDRDYGPAYAEAAYATPLLEADVAAEHLPDGRYGVHRHPRQAAALLTLDTPARRQRADHEAQTRQNLQGGTLGACIQSAARDLRAMIAADREDTEMWAEGAARRHREAEAAIREATGRRVILYPPEMRRG